MNGRNIFFGLCTSMVIASELSAMQLVTKRASRPLCRVNSAIFLIQKRNFNDEKERENREFLEKIKTVAVMGTKTWQSNNQQQCNQQRYTPQQQYTSQQHGKADDSRRGNDVNGDLTKFMMHAYVATQICGNLTAHSDSSSSSLHTSSIESSSSDSSSSSYSNAE
jgi:hypothetical protein